MSILHHTFEIEPRTKSEGSRLVSLLKIYVKLYLIDKLPIRVHESLCGTLLFTVSPTKSLQKSNGKIATHRSCLGILYLMLNQLKFKSSVQLMKNRLKCVLYLSLGKLSGANYL